MKQQPPITACQLDCGIERAARAARRYLIETPERAVYSIKRLMGRGLEDIQEELKLFPFQLADDLNEGEVLRIKIGDRTYTPPEISG